MSENFKKTVNLRDKMKEASERKQTIFKEQENKSKEIDKLYEQEKSQKKSDFKKITHPSKKENNPKIYKSLIFVLLIIVLVLFYYSFIGIKNKNAEKVALPEEQWSAVLLTNGKMYYGLVGDKTADPVVVKNVYYNYDKADNSTQDTSNNIRLIKQGKEAYGPDSSLSIIRSQIESIAQLNKDSKVLSAILANEK